tara:strand:- start:169 stop:579 length:411 start_codon:yes stop_codon:yes gene_type:complete
LTSTNKNSFSLIPKEISQKLPLLNEERDMNLDPVVYAHLFGIIGDWYITEISDDRTTAFGYKHIEAEKEWEMEESIPNGKGWCTFSVDHLQKLVNNEFLKEKDIRFLIVRDVFWEPVKFSTLNIQKSTLKYPGPSD